MGWCRSISMVLVSLEPLISVFGDLSAGGSIKHFIIMCVFLLPLFVISERRNNISWKGKVKVVLSSASQLLLAQVISYICHNNQSVRRSGYLNLNKVVLVSLFTIDSVSMKDLKIVPVHLSKNYMHRVVGRARKQSENKFFTCMYTWYLSFLLHGKGV